MALAIPFLLEQAQAVKANTPRFGGVHDNGVLVSFILSSWGREVHRSMTGVTTCLELMNNQIAMLKSWWAAKSQNIIKEEEKEKRQAKCYSCAKLMVEVGEER